MNHRERNEFKEQLRAMAAGRGDGIDLDSVERWVIEGLSDPVAFFAQLHLLIPGDSCLYFEGCTIASDVSQLYEAHRVPKAICVVRDTIFPVPDTYHVSLEKDPLTPLRSLIQVHSKSNCFDHVKAYRDGKLLFTFHDAFDEGAALLISDQLDEAAVSAFSSRLGGTFFREQNINKRDPEQLRRLLLIMEHPEKFRVNWPWWKKVLLFWKR